MTDNAFTIAMFAVLAVLIFFMFRNSRRRKQQQEDLRAKIVPGAEVMTNFGLFGTLRSIDEVSNVAEIETSPGTIVRVHRQTLAKVVTPDDEDAPKSVEEAMERANREAELKEVELNQDHAIPVGEPKYGERVADAVKKPVRRPAKKSTD
jgi:preprotein translocase subunit YajC